jgi:hypothetical protein
MKDFWYIKGDFTKERSGRIGGSDIAALIPSGEKPNESLAGHGRTPITVFQEKTGRKKRDPAGLPAEMGHFLEPKVLELFIREKFNYEIGKEFIRKKIIYELSPKNLNASDFQVKPFYHNTQYYTTEGKSGKIVHADCIVKTDKEEYSIESKSANFFAARRPTESKISGYDLDLEEWQGIPLKHYVQCQYQLDLLELDYCYLPLIYNTSQFQYWKIKANKKHQNQIMDLVDNMIWHINKDIAPKEMILNQNDVKELHPKLQDDFVMISGEERDQAIEIAGAYNKAHEQEKKWKNKKQEAADSMSILLKDVPELRDENGIIAKWQVKKASERVKGLKDIKKIRPLAYKYLNKWDLINTSEESRSVSIKWKGEI